MKRLFLLFAVLIFGFACSQNANVNTNSSMNHKAMNHNAMTDANAPMNHNQMNQDAEKKNMNFKTEMSPNTAQTGKETEFTFVIKDKNGKQVKDFKVVHEMKMHMIAVSDDLAEFEHLHPELQADGSFKVTHTFKHGGKFLFYADATPENGSQVIQRFEINVDGAPKTPEKLVVDTNLQKIVDGISVTMKPDKEIKANEKAMLNFVVTDETTGKPVTDLQNYLGELAHIVVISQDTQEYLHVHPTSNKTADETSATAHTTFPKAGVYKIWVQFQRNNKVSDVPFVVNVS